MGGWMWERDIFLLSSSGGIPLDTVTTVLKKLKFFEFVGLLSTSEFPSTFSRQDGWHILRTEQRHRTERQCPCVFESLSGSERERILVSSENEMQVSIEQKTMLSLLREGFNHIWWLLSSYLHATLIDLISALYRHASFSIANNIIIPFSSASSFITKINLKVTSYFI